MDGLEEKLGSILGNPEMMQKIMGLAQSLGAQEPKQEQQAQQQSQGPSIDPTMLQTFAGLARQSGVDRDQQALLRALGPYLSHQRIHKLEQAMRAAKMAKMAATVLNRQDMKLFSPR